MPTTLEFFFDFVSPATYLAWTQMHRLAERTGAEIQYKPMFLGGLLREIDHHGNIENPNKFAYTRMDVIRCAEHLGVPLTFPEKFPVTTLPFLRGAAALQRAEAPAPELEKFMGRTFEAIWREGRNLHDEDDQNALIAELWESVDAFKAAISEPETKAALAASTSEAAKRGAFGAPTFFVGDEMFWGHDRLDYIERALAGAN